VHFGVLARRPTAASEIKGFLASAFIVRFHTDAGTRVQRKVSQKPVTHDVFLFVTFFLHRHNLT